MDILTGKRLKPRRKKKIRKSDFTAGKNQEKFTLPPRKISLSSPCQSLYNRKILHALTAFLYSQVEANHLVVWALIALV